MKRRLLSFSALILVLTACAVQPSAREEKAPAAAGQASATFYRDGLNGVDFSGMDSVAKERALQILNSNKCDCGCGMQSIAECRVKDPGCPRSPVLASTIVDAVRSGKSDQQVLAALNGAKDQNQKAQANVTPPPATAVAKVEIPLDKAPSLGPDGASITVVEFADFQCPYCSRAAPVMKEIQNKYPDVKVAYKHYPLPFHQNAKPAGIAAVAAQKQNKFWEMYDLLYKNQGALDTASLRRYAESLGLDMAAYDKVVADPETARFIEQETLDAQKAMVQGTPTFFVNGVQAPSWDFPTVQKLIEAAKSGGDVGMTAGQMKADQIAAQMKARANQAQPPQIDYSKVYDIDIAGSPMRGPTSAPVTIVEFSDFQCPYCAGAESLFDQVLKAYPNQVRLVYKHFPLTFHQNARPASEAAMFAKQHGKFWEMHALLFKNFSNLTMENMKSFARELGLDEKALEASVSSQAFKGEIEKDIAEARKAQVTGTPTIFINGKRLQQRTFEGFKSAITEALNAKASAGSPSSN